jgi:hypothetical protein
MRKAKCSCGADIEEVLDTPISAGKFWLRAGTAEVCTDNHWHEPLEEVVLDPSVPKQKDGPESVAPSR